MASTRLVRSPSTYSGRNRPFLVTGAQISSPSRADIGSSSFSPPGTKASSIKLATNPTHWFSAFFRTV